MNKALFFLANSLPSASGTSRYSAKSHLLPKIIIGHYNIMKTILREGGKERERERKK